MNNCILSSVNVGQLNISCGQVLSSNGILDNDNKIKTEALAISRVFSSIDDIDENATAKETKSKINEILSALRGTLAVVCAIFASFALADSLDPSDKDGIQQNNIPGNVHMYTKDQIDYMMSPTNQYAMFIIPLNCQLDDHFTTFELKASTNNFTAANEWDRIVFWSMSTHADIEQLVDGSSNVVNCDAMRLYIENIPRYYDKFATNIIDASQLATNSAAIDSRRYTRISNSFAVNNDYVLDTEDLYYVASYVVIVDASLCRKHLPAEEWLKSSNNELVWAYSRARASGVEKDQHGRILWRPIAPVRWFNSLPKWADCEPIDKFDESILLSKTKTRKQTNEDNNENWNSSISNSCIYNILRCRVQHSTQHRTAACGYSQ